jgi:hypothetical protein
MKYTQRYESFFTLLPIYTVATPVQVTCKFCDVKFQSLLRFTYMTKHFYLNLDVIWTMLRYWQWKQPHPGRRTGIPSSILYLPERQRMTKCHSEISGSLNSTEVGSKTLWIKPRLFEYATFKIFIYLSSNNCSYCLNSFTNSKYSVLLNCQRLIFNIECHFLYFHYEEILWSPIREQDTQHKTQENITHQPKHTCASWGLIYSY